MYLYSTILSGIPTIDYRSVLRSSSFHSTPTASPRVVNDTPSVSPRVVNEDSLYLTPSGGDSYGSREGLTPLNKVVVEGGSTGVVDDRRSSIDRSNSNTNSPYSRPPLPVETLSPRPPYPAETPSPRLNGILDTLSTFTRRVLGGEGGGVLGDMVGGVVASVESSVR